MNHFKLLIALIIITFTLYSCSNSTSNNTTPVDNSVLVKDLPADPPDAPTGHFIFFSLKNDLVSFSDSATTDWDVAFHSTDIIVNCGVRGPGNGGAIVLKSVDYNNITEAPDTGYATEDSLTGTGRAILGGSGNSWYLYDFNTNLISAIPGVVIIIRTADGKYAKMQILNYYKGAPAIIDSSSISRYYEFKYKYQPNGSKIF